MRAALLNDKMVLVIDCADAVLIRCALNREIPYMGFSSNANAMAEIRDDIARALGADEQEIANWNSNDLEVDRMSERVLG